MSQPVRPFLGESAEQRIEARRRQLVDKAFELLAADTWRQTSIAQLCREVSLNKRYFYESFQDLAEVEAAVVDDLTAQLLATGWKALSEAQMNRLDTAKLARHVLKACISWLVNDPRRARVLFSKASDNPRARAHRDLVVSQLGQTLSNFGLEYHQPQPHPVAVTNQHRTLARLTSSLLIGGTVESILDWIDGKLDLSLDAFVDYVARFWVAMGDSAVSMALNQPEDPGQNTPQPGSKPSGRKPRR